MKYRELDMKKIREENGLDFAHFTYLPGMCSCCFTPLDFPAKYWHKGVKPATMDNVQYLLFKNADNGSGDVKSTQEIKEYQCIQWNFPMEKLEKVCGDLQKQLGDNYQVLVPPDDYLCILCIKADQKERIEDELRNGYTIVAASPMTPEEFVSEAKSIVAKAADDYEAAHIELDALLCRVLGQLGYGEGVRVFEEAKKY